jgi:hypothetical protein
MINKIFLILIFLFIFTGCSSSQNSQNIQSDIFDGTYDDIIFSKASFDDLEFKFSKNYDVSELPDALEAHYGFFQRREFEIRFYPSNQIAKSSGIFFAEEATGEDAIIKKSDASWKEGIKDRMISGVFGNKKNSPKYMDYVIFGNVIVLCPSEKSSAVSGVSDPILNCSNMLNEVVKFVD